VTTNPYTDAIEQALALANPGATYQAMRAAFSTVTDATAANQWLQAFDSDATTHTFPSYYRYWPATHSGKAAVQQAALDWAATANETDRNQIMQGLCSAKRLSADVGTTLVDLAVRRDPSLNPENLRWLARHVKGPALTTLLNWTLDPENVDYLAQHRREILESLGSNRAGGSEKTARLVDAWKTSGGQDAHSAVASCRDLPLLAAAVAGEDPIQCVSNQYSPNYYVLRSAAFPPDYLIRHTTCPARDHHTAVAWNKNLPDEAKADLADRVLTWATTSSMWTRETYAYYAGIADALLMQATLPSAALGSLLGWFAVGARAVVEDLDAAPTTYGHPPVSLADAQAKPSKYLVAPGQRLILTAKVRGWSVKRLVHHLAQDPSHARTVVEALPTITTAGLRSLFSNDAVAHGLLAAGDDTTTAIAGRHGSTDMVRHLRGHSDPLVRTQVCKNPLVDLDTLAILADDPDDKVRLAASTALMRALTGRGTR
jgi:hypothetical protein